MAHAHRLNRVDREELILRYKTGLAPLTIAQFCVLTGISISNFYKLQSMGLAPRQINIGVGNKRRSVRITPEATREWLEARECPSSSAE